MSPIGRILIVVNLLLAAAFLGWASQTLKVSQDWKTKHEELEVSSAAEIEDLEQQNSSLSARLTERSDFANAQQSRAENAETQNNSLKNQIDNRDEENRQLRASLSGLEGRLDEMSRNVDKATARAESEGEAARAAIQAQNEAETSQREAEIAKRDAQDALRRAQERLANLTEQNASLQQLADDQRSQLSNVAQLTGVDLSKIAATKPISGEVIKADLDSDPGFVALNRGSDDGVTRGTVFHIYSGDTYKGEVRVETVAATTCAAVVTIPVPGQPISGSDKATTNL